MKLLKLLFQLTLIAYVTNKFLKPSANREQSEQPRNHHDYPTNEANNHRPIVYTVAIEPSPEDKKRNNEEQRYWERQIRLAKCLNWITTIAAAAGISGFFLLWYTLKATQDAAQAAKEQALAAQKSIMLAEKSFEQTTEQFRLQQRAWVGMKYLRMVTLEVNKPISASITYTNTGQTLALKVRAESRLRLREGKFDLSVEKKVPLDGVISNFTMPPNFESTSLVNTQPITQDILALITSGKVKVYFFGVIRYLDIFGKSHFTEFCGINKLSSNQFDLCSEHNNAN